VVEVAGRERGDPACELEGFRVAELEGRVTILDKDGKVLAHIGTNDNAAEYHVNTTPPSVWKPDRFYAPHGITYDPAGNLLVTEFNQYGRLTRIVRQP